MTPQVSVLNTCHGEGEGHLVQVLPLYDGKASVSLGLEESYGTKTLINLLGCVPCVRNNLRCGKSLRVKDCSVSDIAWLI